MRQRSRQVVKLDDVARLAEVSPSTVSLYVRHPTKISAKTSKKIQKAIDELGYVHNKIASQLTGGRSNTMAVVVPAISNVTFSAGIEYIEKIVSEAGYQLYIASHDHCLEKEEQQIRAILERAPAAIAITGSEHAPATLKLLHASGTPVVQMWETGGENFRAQVGSDHLTVGKAVTHYLAECGCHKLAYVTTRLEDDLRAQRRYTGYKEALKELSLPQAPIVLDIPRSDNLYHAARPYLTQLLVKERGLDGIIASNDSLAVTFLMEAFDRGIKVPEQLSIIGFGDFPYSAYLSPYSLTSVSLKTQRVAQVTAQMMLKMVQNPSYEGEIVDVSYDIIPRKSTPLLL